MASSSTPILSSFPTKISPPVFIPQSWYQWTVSNLTVKTAVIGIVGALVVWTLHRLFNSSESSQPTGRVSQNTPPPKPTIVPKATGKTLPIPVPAHELIAQGFIRIYKNLFHNLDVPPGYTITEIKVRIEDDEGRRIATRYLPDFEDDHDIFSHLPLNRAVTLQFKVTCKHPNREPFIQDVVPVGLGVVETQAAVYHVASQERTKCVPLENRPTQTLQWQPQRPETKTKLCPTLLSVFADGSIKEGRIQSNRKEIVVQNFDGDGIRRIAIALICNKVANQLISVLNYAFIGNGDEKSVPFRFLIKDWKAAYQLENGTKIDYESAKHDLAHFTLESVACDSYVKKLEIE